MSVVCLCQIASLSVKTYSRIIIVFNSCPSLSLSIYHQPVSHYTLASIYLSLNDYVASSLHLRAALRAQPKFQQALNSLQFVRCSLKFGEEHKLLRKKVIFTENVFELSSII